MKPTFAIFLRAFILLAFLFNAAVPIPAGASAPAAAPAQAVVSTPTAAVSPTASLTPGATDIPSTPVSTTPTGTPAPTGAPATATVSPQVSATLTPPAASASPTASAQPTQAASGYSLVLQPDATFLPSGGTLSLAWTIVAPSDTSGLTLQFSLPAGLAPANPNTAGFDAASGTLTIAQPALTGSITLTSASTVDVLHIGASLLQATTQLASTAIDLPAREQFQIGQVGGSLSAMNGRVKVSFPSGVLSNQTLIQVGAPTGSEIPRRTLSGHPFQLNAQDNVSKQSLHQFPGNIALDVSYADLNVPAGAESNLYVYWYNPATGDWNALPSNVDTSTKTIHAMTNHFTVFDIGINNFQISHAPTINDFQVSGFTGAATYSMPIEVPAGPGGLQPNLSLDYNSQVVDQSTTVTQGSWVGMGWSLDVGMIERDAHGQPGYGDPNWTGDDTFSLNLGGMSSTIYADTSGVYHSANENFLKYNYDTTNDIWTVWDKVGNVYTFGQKVQTGFPVGNGSTTCTWGTMTYQWWLTSVTNIYGRHLTYTYTAQTRSIPYLMQHAGSCIWGGSAQATTAVYPSTITYPNGRYRIRFVTQARTDYTNSWDTDAAYHSFEKSRLHYIYVEQDAAGDGSYSTVIRRYRFDYAPDDNTNIWPGIVWSGTGSSSGKTSTLTAILQFGSDNTSHLPGLYFTYGDSMHLTNVQNNLGGGSVAFGYEPTPYTYTANGRQSDTKIDGLSDGQHFFPYSSADTVTYANDGMHVYGNAVNSYLLNNNLHPDQVLIRPGGTYGFYGLSSKSANITVQYGVQTGSIAGGDYTHLHMSTLAADGTPIVSVPATDDQSVIWTVWISAQPNPGTSGGTANYPNFIIKLLTSVYRVTSKTVSDGQGNNYAYSYQYNHPAVNDSATSASACSDSALKALTCFQYNEKYAEYRGNRQVLEIGPDGRMTNTFYNQDDIFKGRPSAITVSDANGNLLSQQIYTYNPAVSLSVASYYPDPNTCNGCHIAYQDIARYWVTLASEEDQIYHSPYGIHDYDSTLKAYTYESTYGNQLTEADSSWNGSSWNLYRTTQSYYKPNASAYLVGLIGAQNVFDALNNVIAQKLYLYDGNTGTWNTPPSVGQLTGVRTWMGSTGYSQVSYSYDGYGNRISVTTYSGYGTSTTNPIGDRTTTTHYETTYHTYPNWEQDPLIGYTTWTYDYTLGLPLSETDPNGNVTTAAYDVFGRLTSLTRPGDTSPTLSVAYVTSIPFEVDLSQNIDGTNFYSVHRLYDGMGRLYQTQTGSTVGVNGTFTPYNTSVSSFDAYGHATSQSAPYASGETQAYTQTSYDVLGRPLVVTAPDGSSVSYAYDGLKTTLTDANGNQTVSMSDVWGRTASVTPPAGPGVSYGYDPLDELTSAVRGGLTTSLTYDPAGRKTAMSDPDMGNWSYGYDALGNLTSQTDARGCALALAYDNLNRLTNKSSTGSGCGTQINTTYSYDQGTNGLGQRTGMTDASGSSAWTYDTHGRMLSETKTIGTNAPFTTGFTYDSADLPVTMTYPDGEVVTNTYNPEMMLSTVSGTSNYITATGYDSAGRMTSRTLGNGLSQSWNYYTWDGKNPNIPGDTSHPGSGGKLQSLVTGTLQNLAYTYYGDGTISQISNSVASETQGYTYDALDRLSNWSLNNVQQESYSYDQTSGNLTTKGSLSLTYTDSAHPHSVTSAGGNTYTYDADGNQVTRTVGGIPYTLGYDAEGHMVSVSGGSLSAQFTYDGDGKMVQMVVGTSTTLYVSPNYQVTDGAVTKYYPGGAFRVNGTLYFALGDQLGSTSLTTDSTGTQVAELRYTPWGEVRSSTGTTPTDRTYTGQRSYMASFGLMFYNARWYDPTIGRFAQADTVVPSGMQGYDRYAYTNNNPINFTDPTGHKIACDDGYLGSCGDLKKEQTYQAYQDIIGRLGGRNPNGLNKWNLGDLNRLIGWMQHGIEFLTGSNDPKDAWTGSNLMAVINALDAVKSYLGSEFDKAMGLTNGGWLAFVRHEWVSGKPGLSHQPDHIIELWMTATSGNDMIFTAAHEMGHFASYYLGKGKDDELSFSSGANGWLTLAGWTYSGDKWVLPDKSGIVQNYAGTSPGEDFADTFAWMAMDLAGVDIYDTPNTNRQDYMELEFGH